jgi:hypothetical protein
MPKFLCLDHKKIIEYTQISKGIIDLMARSFYCEDCIRLLGPINKFKIIDPQDLQ